MARPEQIDTTQRRGARPRGGGRPSRDAGAWRRAGPERGLALLSVLAAVTILAAVAGLVLQRTTTDLRLAAALEDRARATFAADAAINLEIARLLAGSPPPEAEASRLLRDAGLAVSVQVRDEGGRVDLNAASPALLAALATAAGVDADVARRLGDAIVDYRDADAEPSPLGAEAEAYGRAGTPLPPRDAPLATTDELSRVLGASPEIVRALAPHVTVHTQRSRPQEAAADPIVLAALAALEEAGPPDDASAASSARTDTMMSVLQAYQATVAGVAPAGHAFRITAVVTTERGLRLGVERVVEIRPSPAPAWRILERRQFWPAS